MNVKEFIIIALLVAIGCFGIWSHFSGEDRANKYTQQLSNFGAELKQGIDGLKNTTSRAEVNNSRSESTINQVGVTASSLSDNNRKLEDFLKRN